MGTSVGFAEYLLRWKEKVRSAPPVSGTRLTRQQIAYWLIPAFLNTGRVTIIPGSLLLARWTPYVFTIRSELLSSLSFFCPFTIEIQWPQRNLIWEDTMNEMLTFFKSNTKGILICIYSFQLSNSCYLSNYHPDFQTVS